ncbi:STAS domain-containing protein [Streptomyces sp. NPDC002644]
MPPSHPVPHDAGDGRPASGGVPPGQGGLRGDPFRTAGTARLRVRPAPGHEHAPAVRLLLDGELDRDTAATLREDLAVLAARSSAHAVTLDLSGVTFCDLASLYTLLSVRRTMPLLGVEVRLAEPSAAVRTAARRADLVTELGLDAETEGPPPAAPR